MKSLVGTTAALALAGCCLVLIPSAAGTTGRGAKTVHLNSPISALAMSGTRVAYDVAPEFGGPNRILVWNVRTGMTTKVSGRRTAGADGTVGGGVNRLAIAGNRVAWRIATGGNSEADEDVYTSSVLAPKERHVASSVRDGNQCGAGIAGPLPACAGTWFGGFVASGGKLLVNRWTTDTSGAITGGGLYKLHGTKLNPFVLAGTAVDAVAADSQRIAVQQWHWYDPDPTINVYSSSGNPLTTVTPAVQPREVALSGHNLVVLEPRKLVLYDAQTGALKNTFTLHHGWQANAIAVHGDVAVYSTATFRRYNSVRAINLATGKDSFVGRLRGRIQQLRMDSAGVAYANYAWTGHGYDNEVVFRPFAEVAAAVR